MSIKLNNKRVVQVDFYLFILFYLFNNFVFVIFISHFTSEIFLLTLCQNYKTCTGPGGNIP